MGVGILEELGGMKMMEILYSFIKFSNINKSKLLKKVRNFQST